MKRRTAADPRHRRIIATSLRTGDTMEFYGLPSCEAAGFIASNVSRCCNGQRRKHGGYTWRYA